MARQNDARVGLCKAQIALDDKISALKVRRLQTMSGSEPLPLVGPCADENDAVVAFVSQDELHPAATKDAVAIENHESAKHGQSFSPGCTALRP